MANKGFISRLLSHNFVLLILSFIIAFGAWFIINMNSETETNVTISDIPITIELTQEALDDGLQIFSGNDVTASVEVSGNRVTVGSLSPSDIQVTANQASSIISPGTYTLSLSAKKTGAKTNYNIESSVTPANITVFVDRLKEAEFDIENQLVYEVSDGYYASATFSESKVSVSGPETEVSQIDSVAVMGTIEGELSDTVTIEKSIIYLDKDGNELELPLTTADIDTVEVALTVYPVMDVTLQVDVANAPSSYPRISISPSTIKIAGPQDSLDEIEDNAISIGTIDFTKLSNEKITNSYDISLPSNCKNLSGEAVASVSIDLSSNVQKTVSCKIAGSLDSDTYKTDFSSNNIDITVIGPKDVVEEITASNISVIADFTDKLSGVTSSNTVSVEVPLTVTLSSDFDECWIYGSYTANVNISQK